MRAAVVTAIPSHGVDVRDVPRPIPGPGELLLAVEACGICGTDLHILDGTSYRPALPFVLGHEPVGRIAEVGGGGDPALIGQRVTITLFVGDGTCAYCRSGDERLCPELVGITGVLGHPGGFAEYLVVSQDQVVAVPETLDSMTCAALVDGGSTAANAVRVVEELAMRMPRPGRRGPIVVVGAGPIGVLVAELARLASRPVVVVQPSPMRRDAIRAMGFETVAGLDEIDVRPACVVDCAGAPDALSWALDHLAPRGAFVAAGYGLVPTLSFGPAARKELVITGVRSGRREDLLRILSLVASGHVRSPAVTTWHLSDVNDAIEALQAHSVAGKAVIVP